MSIWGYATDMGRDFDNFGTFMGRKFTYFTEFSIKQFGILTGCKSHFFDEFQQFWIYW